jgi:hypothetical protein
LQYAHPSNGDSPDSREYEIMQSHTKYGIISLCVQFRH